MITFHQILKPIVAAIFILSADLSVAQSETPLDQLYDQLAQSDAESWEPVEEQIRREWMRSGSDAMDFLLQRGRAAFEAENLPAAIEHLTALIDHAPDFAEGYHARAQAYYNAGLYGPAIDDLQCALALEPRHFDSIFGLAVVLKEIGHPDDALSLLRVLQTIHPNYPDLELFIDNLAAYQDGQDV